MVLYFLLEITFLANFIDLVHPFCDCGRLHSQTRIVGGEESLENTRPWIVALLKKIDHHNETKYIQYCAGTLISDQWILTAAHCVLPPIVERADIRIAVGVRDKHLLNNTNIYKVSKILVHLKYFSIFNDIALIKLDLVVTLSDNVQVVCLPDEDMIRFDNLLALGWGKRNANDLETPNKLNEVELNDLDIESCKRIHVIRILWLWKYRFVDDNNICAQAKGKGVCNGDSGGPLLYFHRNRYFLVGVVNWIKNCENSSKYPHVFARVTSFLNWIKESTNRDVCLNEDDKL